METRTLGRTGLAVSVLGFGCGAVGGLMVRGNPADQERAIARAVELGINYFDTAAMYGNGESERNLGRVLKSLKPDIFVGTKVRVPDGERSRVGAAVTASLEASLQRRFRNGLNLRAAYTYSRSTDNTPAELEANSGSAPNGRNYNAWYAASDFDIPQRLAVSYFYELPFGHGKPLLSEGFLSRIFGGFRTSGVYTFYSGHPVTVTEGGAKFVLDPFGQATPVPNAIAVPRVVGSPDCWFFVAQNTHCPALAPGVTDTFQLTAPGQVGSSGRNTVRGPHTTVFDAALMREFSMTEKAKLEFRWEVFNVANTPEFGQPSGNFNSGAGGQITTLSGDPRVMQFALRVTF